MTTGINAAKTRGKPFAAGNPGRPKGARHRATVAAEALLDGEAEGLTRKAIDMALGGDTVALRLCLERLIPPRRDRPIAFAVPAVATVADLGPAFTAVLASVAAGKVTPLEAKSVVELFDGARRAFETGELAERIARLEAGV
jgi:hypothetical protein